VLYAALGLQNLRGTELRRANSRLIVFSALFGIVRPNDRIPAYRLSGGTNLPPIGALTRFWRPNLAPVIAGAAGGRLIVDLRSAPYAQMWSPAEHPGAPCVSIKVWHRTGAGQRQAVSHHNKATKGALARLLATASDAPGSADEVVDLARTGGWDVETDPGSPGQLAVYC
jgi:hypothetical protein